MGMRYPCDIEADERGLNAHIVGCPICREFALALAVASQSTAQDRPDRDWPDALDLLIQTSSQAEVGRALEVSPVSVWRWREGHLKPSTLRQEQITRTAQQRLGNNWRTLR